MSVPVLRFAPSPNGELHLGHAYSALLGFDTARRLGARFLLRIEDIDIGRCRREFEEAIYEDLAWLGIAWERPVRRQSDHFADYRAAGERLRERGLLYPCFATRAEVAAARQAWSKAPPPVMRDPDGALLYPGLYRDLDPVQQDRLIAQGRRFALRLDMAHAVQLAGPLTWSEIGPEGEETEIAADPAAWGDVVVVRKDVPTSYHLAVVVDDARQGVSYVTRGRDLYHQTAIHRLLQRLLDLPEPVYSHHRLILDADGRKLSKSRRDTSLRALRQAGATPTDIRRMVGLAAPG